MINPLDKIPASLRTRLLSALVLIPVSVLVIYMGGLVLGLFITALAFISLYEWLQMARKSEHVVTLAAAGLVYVPLSFLCGYVLREEFGFASAILLALLIWGSDIAGYVFGKLIGGPKLVEAISPNKTWAGFFGAFFIPGLIAVGWVQLYDLYFDAQQGVVLVSIMSFALGACIGIVGQAGDLLMSSFKRVVGVKDTGTLIPGHGGLLDRIDSLLLGMPVFLAFVSSLSYIL